MPRAQGTELEPRSPTARPRHPPPTGGQKAVSHMAIMSKVVTLIPLTLTWR